MLVLGLLGLGRSDYVCVCLFAVVFAVPLSCTKLSLARRLCQLKRGPSLEERLCSASTAARASEFARAEPERTGASSSVCLQRAAVCARALWRTCVCALVMLA